MHLLVPVHDAALQILTLKLRRVRQAIVDGQRLLLLLMMACQTLQNGHLHRTHVMLQQLRSEQFDEWIAAGQKAK